jgi:hypothetical protein
MKELRDQKMKTDTKFQDFIGGNRKMKNLGNIFRIITAIGLVTILFMAVNAKPATAEDGSPDGIAQVRTPHPCSIAANLRRQLESEWETCRRLEEILSDAQDNLRELSNRMSELFFQISALRDEIANIFGGHPSWPIDRDSIDHLSRLEFLSAMERFLEYYRSEGYRYEGWDIELVDQLEEILNELRSLVADYEAILPDAMAAQDLVESSAYRCDSCRDDIDTSSYRRAQDACNLTRCYFSRSLQDGQMQNLMSLYEGPMFLDSDTNQASNEVHSRMPSGVPEKNLPKAQIMQVDRQESSKPGTNAAGYTHMTLPQNTDRSKPAFRTTGTLRATPSFKRK